jgi:UDP-glucose 4-epimerase
MRIAVTGATGMVGAALAEVASERNIEVLALVRPGSRNLDNIPVSERISVTECAMDGYSDLEEGHCDIFFNLAWNGTFGAEREDTKLQASNIVNTLEAVHLASRLGCRAFVGVGSQAEYGSTDVPLNGDTHADPKSGYGIAKYAAGKLSAIECRHLDIRFCWARLLSVYGELSPDSTVLKYVINTLLDGGRPSLTNCDQVWDFMYSRDAAEALLAIGERGRDGRTYCVGSGCSSTLRESIETVRDLIDPALPLGFGEKEYYPNQAMHLVADISDLRSDTGFVPRFGFKAGVSRVIDHCRRRDHSGLCL